MKSLIAGIALLLFVGGSVKADNILNASYNDDGTPKSSGTDTLDSFTVDYLSAAASGEVFIQDSSGAFGEIFSTSFLASTAVGDSYTNFGITLSLFPTTGTQYEEFKPNGTIPTPTTGNPVSFTTVLPSQISNATSVSPDFPTDGSTSLLYAPVMFDTGIMTQTLTFLSTTTSSAQVLTTADGTTINLFRPTTSFTLNQGQEYILEGVNAPFGGIAEVVNPQIFETVQAPEPSSKFLLGLGALALLGWGGRRWAKI